MNVTRHNVRGAAWGVVLAGAMALVISLSACRWEVGKLPLPTPTPTPSPTPTPTPEADMDLLSEVLSLESVSALSVAEGNAEMLAAATSQAVDEAGVFSEAMQRAAALPTDAAEELPRAMEALSAVRQSYQQAEAAVFYVDPASPAELAAQPDPLGSGTDGESSDSLADVSAMFEELVTAAGGKLDAAALGRILPVLGRLAERSKQLVSDMESLAAAWRDSDSSFRTRYFSAEPDNAVARMFQGLLALSGDVLPNRARATGALTADEITGRIGALHGIYLGERDAASPTGAPGLEDLVMAASPLRAAAVEGAIAQAAALSQALVLSPENTEARRQLLAALDEVTRQLVLSAEALGIRVVEENQAAPD